jgi:hypothetical protein
MGFWVIKVVSTQNFSCTVFPTSLSSNPNVLDQTLGRIKHRLACGNVNFGCWERWILHKLYVTGRDMKQRLSWKMWCLFALAKRELLGMGIQQATQKISCPAVSSHQTGNRDCISISDKDKNNEDQSWYIYLRFRYFICPSFQTGRFGLNYFIIKVVWYVLRLFWGRARRWHCCPPSPKCLTNGGKHQIVSVQHSTTNAHASTADTTTVGAFLSACAKGNITYRRDT